MVTPDHARTLDHHGNVTFWIYRHRIGTPLRGRGGLVRALRSDLTRAQRTTRRLHQWEREHGTNAFTGERKYPSKPTTPRTVS